MNEIEIQGHNVLEEVLSRVPIVDVDDIRPDLPMNGSRIDLVANIRAAGRPYRLLCEVLPNGQPRYVRHALLRLREYAARATSDIVPILIAPYFSPGTRALCRQHRVGYLDFEGNILIAFGGVFIERQVTERATTERRELKSLFKPKSARVLRAMLRAPERSWKVAELADATGVSVGQVSNVRAGLLNREWAATTQEGIRLSEPGAVIDAWRDIYEGATGERYALYTTLHGAALEKAARDVLGARDTEHPAAAFASFSAANWIAPYGRSAIQYFYATKVGYDRLTAALNLKPAPQGENVVITLVGDDGVLADTIEPAPGAVCTSLVQTYLDLTLAGERGMEAARHLREATMKWQP
ncbi:hypothetical protein WL77_03105 [Burkholderia ubonensis]|uniref:hypothetical protein n=1 Tax=Burkholderia ubonensis TaxID=101571 RepID=UPI00016A4368|nr:hypothetical protein [Burkholderia ubonensis]KWE59700.1 hypothetical protein WL77_03105 [Burkholderia ubonensis]KWE67466.1 hypothetical protein WL79_26725 [Burkholderia ubonensis]